MMVLILFLCFSMLAGVCSAENLRPIIGIATEQSHIYSDRLMIAASYVKYLEGAGARVVPVLSNSTDDQLRYMFNSINGILFPGGGVSLSSSPYLHTGLTFLKMAKEAKESGDYFPVWGTCLGFQLLCVVEAGNADILTTFDSENYSIPLNFTSTAAGSRMFSGFSSEALEWVQTEPLTMNNHHRGVTPQVFKDTLSSFYSAVSVNADRNGKEFVSGMEAINYPIYGVQWHPEKIIYEWTSAEGINHSEHAVIVAQTLANFFVQEASKSRHSFPSTEEENSMLIYNYSPTYTHDSFEQIYYF